MQHRLLVGHLGIDTCFFHSKGYPFIFLLQKGGLCFTKHMVNGPFPLLVSLDHSKPVSEGLVENSVASVLPSLPESAGSLAPANLYFG